MWLLVPSWLHEGIVRLLMHRPRLAAELLDGVGSLSVGHVLDQEAELYSEAMTDMQPASLRCDAVVKFGDPVSMAVIVEVQLREDPKKLFTWPAYTAWLRHRLRCPVTLLVVTLDEGVAAWARTPVVLSPGAFFAPVVVGPESIPRIMALDQACRDPELAVLSALAHGQGVDAAHAEQGAQIDINAIQAADTLDAERSELYPDIVVASLGPLTRRLLEELMKLGKWELQSDWAKKYFAMGRQEGRQEGIAQALLELIAARGLPPLPTHVEQVRSCTDVDQLNEWLRRAATADSLDAIFGRSTD